MARLDPSAIESLARHRYGVEASASPLPGELDENWRLAAPGGDHTLRFSHRRTRPADLAAECAALELLKDVDLGFHVPRLVPDVDGVVLGEAPDGRVLRLMTWVPGIPYAELAPSEQLDRSIGRTAGRLAVALAPLHGGEREDVTWNLVSTVGFVSDRIHHVGDPYRRRIVERTLAEVDTAIPWKTLPQAVVHNDLNDLNVLAEDARVTGVIDFGDLMRTYRAAEPAIAATYAMLKRRRPLAVAERIVSAFCAEHSLLEGEAVAVFDLIRARLLISVVESAGRLGSGNPHHQVSAVGAWDLLERLDAADSDRARSRLAAAAGHGSVEDDDLLARRRTVMGASLSLSYDEPLTVVLGRGAHLFDDEGSRFVDCVNNVAHVGHAHPHVVGATVDQLATLNTNTRYLHRRRLDYIDRLLATLPDHLEVVYLVNSGSEATDLAVRLARMATGRHAMAVFDHGYHGNTVTAVDLSAYKFDGPGGAGPPPWVRVLPVPDAYRGSGGDQYRSTAAAALADFRPAALIAETLSGCGGQLVPPSGAISAAVDAVRRLGGLLISDEVQTGFGRVGDRFWSFQLYDLEPDIVTLGKPMGNGHPIGGVATTRSIADAFANGMEWFNTFGGNPVSVAAGNAVLDVLDDEALPAHAARLGRQIETQLADLALEHEVIGDVRGHGLFLGIDLVRDRSTRTPDPDTARHVIDRAARRGVLLSTDGPGRNVIKIKPPLPFSESDAEQMIEAIEAGLVEAPPAS